MVGILRAEQLLPGKRCQAGRISMQHYIAKALEHRARYIHPVRRIPGRGELLEKSLSLPRIGFFSPPRYDPIDSESQNPGPAGQLQPLIPPGATRPPAVIP